MSNNSEGKKQCIPLAGRSLIVIGLLMVPVIGLYFVNQSSTAEPPAAEAVIEAADITVFKNPSCGCCGKWIDHLRDSGFSVAVHERDDMLSLKSELGVQAQFQSCHTAKIGNYIIEGHVPAADIQRLMVEKPDIKLLTVPGMPMGSPGMEGHRKDNYAVLAIDDAGTAGVFNRY